MLQATLVRHAIRVRGSVQGVGFRPFVYRLAHEEQLSGWVCNDPEGVLLEVQGAPEQVARFRTRLHSDAPPLARVVDVQATPGAPVASETGFIILPSRMGPVKTAVPPDTATCTDCLTELFNPDDRRYRHAFINCTQCGPRYTITQRLPYDRAMTSMARFVQCPLCQLEYTDPGHRRFHAEPNACPVCGPRLSWVDASGSPLPLPQGDAIAAALSALLAGQIVAIKGLGGFHLACDARNAAAVARLRRRKQRDEKPFAVMLANRASAIAWVDADAGAVALLESPERPILLLPRRGGLANPLPGVAPGLHTLGVMLPATPIQYLLFHEAAGRPRGLAWLQQPQDLVLVMTSANPGGEPLVTGNAEALQRLQGMADAWLLHDRDIVARCDDSVLRAAADGGARFIRRARGYTPRPIRLARAGPSVLATGAWLKNTVCLTRGDEAFVSPHIGSLDNAATCEAMAEMVQHLCGVLDVMPQAVAHDLHPDFFSTRFALQWAQQHGRPALAVQHHHAHLAAVAAEHGFTAPLLGLALDGVGLGSDGSAWGGELLWMHGAECRRIGHLAPISMPGGDAAAREPWRLAAAALHTAGRGHEIGPRFAGQAAAAAVAQMLQRGVRCPATTSLGRWFDAAAALLDVRQVNAHEGQAAMLLEARAEHPVAWTAALSLRPAAPHWMPLSDQGLLDPLPLLMHLAGESDAARGAALFHGALAHGLARWLAQAAAQTGVRTVALGGGCFLNHLLVRTLLPLLAQQGLQVLQARQMPPNDGAIALGQAWVALCTIAMQAGD